MNFSSEKSENPFVGPIPPTVHLTSTPLTGVLVQVKFPEILSIAKTEFVADFQESIRAEYPIQQLDQQPVLELKNFNVTESLVPHWRFLNNTSSWRISLTTNFVSLETRAYESRLDFAQRFDTIVRALSKSIKPGLTTQIGVRYVDRIHGPQLEKICRYIRPEILGLYSENHRNNLSRTFSEVVSETDVGAMTSRWGYMPSNQTHEPDLMPPISTQSWFLDTDVYKKFTPPESFDADKIESCVTSLATRAYGFFRWVVSEEFLEACGGNL